MNVPSTTLRAAAARRGFAFARWTWRSLGELPTYVVRGHKALVGFFVDVIGEWALAAVLVLALLAAFAAVVDAL